MKKFVLVILLAAMPMIALAHSYTLGNISIGHAWMRAVPEAGRAGAAYMPLLLNGKDDEYDVLLAATTPLAERVEFHDTRRGANDVVEMKHLDKIVLVANRPIAMRPSGVHLMLIGMKKPVAEGDKIPLTLEFKNAGKIDIELHAAAMGAEHSGH
jgi:copper(I)-binding protein